MARSTPVTWHWICIDDDDLAYLLDGPVSERTKDEWIDSVIAIVEDGLETA